MVDVQDRQPRRDSSALLIGGMMVYLFSALSMEAVGRAGGAVVKEVAASSASTPGSWTAPRSPSTASAWTSSRARRSGR